MSSASDAELENEVNCEESTDNISNNDKANRDSTCKKKKRGIIYLSTIPKYMNITIIREIFSAYGTVGRVYLQLADNVTKSGKPASKSKKVRKNFTEGWVEFESKRIAKFVATTLNNKQISNKKGSKHYDVMWNIKYLPGFKWVHLSERLAYERAVHKQRLRTEIAQAKREANFFAYNVDRSRKLSKKQQSDESGEVLTTVRQRDTDMEIRSRKKSNEVGDDRTDILKSLFN